jgi:hypothetical protein
MSGDENALGEGALGDMILGPGYGAFGASDADMRVVYTRSESRSVSSPAEARTVFVLGGGTTVNTRAESRSVTLPADV